jgi:hypothetical protein
MINIYYIVAALILTPWSHSLKAASLSPGLLESLEKIQSIEAVEEKKYPSYKQASQDELTKLIAGKKTFALNGLFLQRALLSTDHKWMAFLEHNPCALADLLWLKLLGLDKQMDSALLDVQNNQASFDQAWVSFSSYAKYLFSSACPESQKTAYAYSPKMMKESLKKISVKKQIGMTACRLEHEKLLKSSEAIYLCYLVDQAKDGQQKLSQAKIQKNSTLLNQYKKNILDAMSIKEYLGEDQFNYYDTFCENTDQPEKFCKRYYSEDYWIKLAQNSNKSFLFDVLCPNKKNPSQCAQSLGQSKDQCTTLLSNFPALTPRPLCAENSAALNASNMEITSFDCPGNIEHLGVTNIMRLRDFFQPQKNPVSQPNRCDTEVNASFYEWTKSLKLHSWWGKEFCYQNNLMASPVCAPFILSSHTVSNNFSLALSNLLKKQKIMDQSYTCLEISSKEFNSSQLKFQSGCWIITNPSCTSTSCPINITIDGRDLSSHVTQKGITEFPYQEFNEKNRYQNAQYYLQKEMQLNAIELKNVLSLVQFLTQAPLSLVHGIGCAQDLLPNAFKQYSLSSCQPLPFIVSGALQDEQKNWMLSTKLSIDGNFVSRLIPWPVLISAVEHFATQHPQNAWSLIGLRKEKTP